jgi:ADP-ribose pyrophosphatase YjhB (NUDIX family)
MEIKIIAHALISNKKGECLFIRRCKQNDVLPGVWDVPGGSIEQGESVTDGLNREVLEETNLNIINVRPKYLVENVDKSKNIHFVKIIFEAELVSGSVQLNSEEHDDFIWTDHNGTSKLNLVDYLGDMLRK